MAQQRIETDSLPRVTDARVEILTSKWYPDHVKSMRDACLRVLKQRGVSDVNVHVLPGTMEFPFAASVLAQRTQAPDAIICLSIVVQGETRHFDMIIDEVARGLGAVSRETHVPIINEILPVTDMDQATARTADDEFNKGIEAAAAALEMIAWVRSQRTSQ